MSTFVYAPGIKVYIDSYKLGQVVDVSADLTGAGMQRRADGVSQFQFGLINPLRKYDNVFTPNDRIVVVMKRLTWMRTFTGYLNSVPVFSSWPRDVNLTASCSIKRLQYFFWDPDLAASQNLVRNSLRLTPDGGAADGGLKQVVINLLEEVVDWSGAQATKNPKLAGSKIHIGAIPKQWFNFAANILRSVAENVEEQALIAAGLYGSVGGQPVLAGVEPGVGSAAAPGYSPTDKTGPTIGVTGVPAGPGNIPTGTQGLNDKQRGYANQILAVAYSEGATDTEAAQCMACCLVESTLYQHANRAHPETLKIPYDRISADKDSVGFYQQRPSQGWGTPAQCMEIGYSTRKFLGALRKVRNRDQLGFGPTIQAVQRSGFPNKYAVQETKARAIVAAYKRSAGVASLTPGAITAGSPAQRGTATAESIVRTAQRLVAMQVPYRYGSVTKPDDPAPADHDCSSFVEWVYFQTIGSMNGIPSQSSAQYAWAKSRGREISVEDGLNTPGALLFKGRGSLAIGHVEISMGGGRSIGTRKTGTNASEMQARSGYWTRACLMPAVIYPNNPLPIPAAGSTADIGTDGLTAANDPFRPNGSSLPTGVPPAGAAIAARINLARNSALDILNSPQTGDSLFGAVPWANAQEGYHGLAESLRGIRALSNDTPILPYITSLMNATMRQFCSAPNGDFMGWFPDYYGIWGTAAKMVLQPIEVRDFTVSWNDEYMVTHQYVSQVHDGGTQLDLSTGQVSALNVLHRSLSYGVATIDQPSIMGALFGLDQTDDEQQRFTDFIYQRFGPRPNYNEIPGVHGQDGEFFMALFLFMQNWTAAYNANIEITFMPELWPGMLIQFPEFNFQAYVNTVEHTIGFGPGGGYKTRINIQAPARIKDLGPEDRLIGLPLAGAAGATPGGGRSSQPVGGPAKPQPNPKLART